MENHKPSTEDVNKASEGLDTRSPLEIVTLMHQGDAEVHEAVGRALPTIAEAAGDAARAVRAGGIVYYAGAGTSGRLAMLDASEVRPTYGSTAFRAAIAGGARAMAEAVEGAEDDAEAGAGEASVLGPNDMALGISASGTTPYVLGFVKAAMEQGARTWMLTCASEPPSVTPHGLISLLTGPELIAGSTRLKAGTATKMALNMLSVTTMVLLGGSYDGLMVDLVPSNSKLKDRAVRIIMKITGRGREEASSALEASGMKPKTASLMLIKGISAAEATKALAGAGGSLRKAMG